MFRAKYFFSLLCCSAAFTLSAQHDFEQFMELDRYNTYAYLNQADRAELEKFKKAFLESSKLCESTEQLIPSTIHIVWVGSKEFPLESCSKMQSWKQHHPNWKFIFWTDRLNRNFPIQDAEVRTIQDYTWEYSAKLLAETTNPGEKSDLLRYEILYRWGGLYVDHDIECFAPFDSIHRRFLLYAFLEPPHYIPGYPLAIFPNNGLIGASANNPIIKAAMDEVNLRWKLASSMRFPNTFTQVLYRTFQPFTIALRNHLENSSYRAIAFPAAYLYPPEHIRKFEFNKRIQQQQLFANHSNDGLWFKNSPLIQTRKDAFEAVYRNDAWGFSMPASSNHAKPYLDWLASYLDQHPEIETILDVGCSNGRDFELFDWKGRNYIGIDIIESALPRTIEKNGTRSTTYFCLDFLESPLPKADLVLCKDVLMHLCHEDVKKALQILRQYPVAVIVNDNQNKILRFLVNNEIATGKYHCLDLQAFPYFLEPSDAISYSTPQSIKDILLFERSQGSGQLAQIQH